MSDEGIKTIGDDGEWRPWPLIEHGTIECPPKPPTLTTRTKLSIVIAVLALTVAIQIAALIWHEGGFG